MTSFDKQYCIIWESSTHCQEFFHHTEHHTHDFFDWKILKSNLRCRKSFTQNRFDDFLNKDPFLSTNLSAAALELKPKIMD